MQTTTPAAKTWIAALLAAASAAGPSAARAANPPGDAEIVFGLSAPFSGPSREYGRQLKVGYEVAFAAANDAGGVAGRKLRLVARDDGYDVARTQVAVKDLLESHKVFGLVGVFGTMNSAAVLPYVLQSGTLMYAPYTGSSLLRNDPPDRYVFNYRPSYPEETSAAVKYLVEVKRIRPSEIAVFMQDDGFGEGGWKGVERTMRRYRRDPGSVLRVTYPRNTVDVEAAVKAVREHEGRVRAVVMVAVYKPAARFIERLRSNGAQNVIFTNVSAVGPNELAEQLTMLGPKYAKNVIVTQVVPLPVSRATAILKYQDALKRYTPGEQPDFVSLEAFVAANVLIEALKRAGRTLTTDAVVDALESIRGLDLGIGVPLTFGPSEHQASHKVWGTVLDANGGYRTIELD